MIVCEKFMLQLIERNCFGVSQWGGMWFLMSAWHYHMVVPYLFNHPSIISYWEYFQFLLLYSILWCGFSGVFASLEWFPYAGVLDVECQNPKLWTLWSFLIHIGRLFSRNVYSHQSETGVTALHVTTSSAYHAFKIFPLLAISLSLDNPFNLCLKLISAEK